MCEDKNEWQRSKKNSSIYFNQVKTHVNPLSFMAAIEILASQQNCSDWKFANDHKSHWPLLFKNVPGAHPKSIGSTLENG